MDVLEESFISILTCYYEFRGSVTVHKGGENPPKEAHYTWCIEYEWFLKSTGIVHWNTGYNLFDCWVRQIPNIIDTLQIVYNVPILDLSR